MRRWRSPTAAVSAAVLLGALLSPGSAMAAGETCRGEAATIVSAPGGNEEAPAGYDPSTPYLIGDDELSAVVGDAPAAAEGEPGGGSGGDATRRTSGLVVGALSLVSLAAGVVLLRRRRPA